VAVYKIVELGDSILREKARPVPEVNQNIRKLLDNMSETLYASKGVGLAAPQIGISKRVIVIDVGDGLHGLINPEIVERKGDDVAVEGCLSIPGVAGEVNRSAAVVVNALNREGHEVKVKATGLGARALQHEIDHLDGILFIDKVSKFVDEK
jgi:peptide deformylase